MSDSRISPSRRTGSSRCILDIRRHQITCTILISAACVLHVIAPVSDEPLCGTLSR